MSITIEIPTAFRRFTDGAPKVGDARAWKKLSDRGLKSLGASALEGVRRMPPPFGGHAPFGPGG